MVTVSDGDLDGVLAGGLELRLDPGFWDMSREGSIGSSSIKPKMPHFGNMFSPKKMHPWKSASLSNLHSLNQLTQEVELGPDYGIPTTNLEKNQQLEKENHLLQLKVGILLAMFSEVTAKALLMEKELDEWKSVSRVENEDPKNIR
ncbi:hypothetical protein P7K49_013966 [Saguinus oedipus]|uniref:Uncharacterized protein n=1 Tax=Saguinus oedipus TaxID=9490 RepID=A0ABQ9VI09_SAGOE|nr:hypothetical protein P7K49_013966 [Saguinus oedipus]